ncbi:putative sulfate exporter family transporter [Glycomyces sp. L485]|uniref:YeiH family protein n=1 Tax=Glycomyces sp. L485 TaxID=2909235 RepID=UPI001F4A8310|nr:putative sulfate exporter family transporter [Glycomyces sp. L485]MCH7230560.1 putative sulfate exporter family transporter [Glycomyces sp. L485]
MTAPLKQTVTRGSTVAVGWLALGVLLAWTAHSLVPVVGLLTWSVLLGLVAGNIAVIRTGTRVPLAALTKRVLRIGVVLLGLGLSAGAVLSLGLPVLGLVAAVLGLTLAGTTLLGLRLGLGGPRSLLLGTGFAICGASAIAAMEEHAGADEEDVAVAVGMVTLFGTVAMVGLPLLQEPLGLSATSFGIWVGASVHEVGQVVGAAGGAGAFALGLAVVVKLTRVLLLAPVVLAVAAWRRRRARRTGGAVPPVVPVFVAGFVLCVALRSTGLLPEWFLAVAEVLQQVTLAAALFGMGTAVRLRALAARSGPALVVASVSTLFIAGASLAGVLALA